MMMRASVWLQMNLKISHPGKNTNKIRDRNVGNKLELALLVLFPDPVELLSPMEASSK